MTVNTLLQDLFPAGYDITSADGLLLGFGTTSQGDIAVMGTTNHLALDSATALELAAFVLKVVKQQPGCPVLMLVDTQGQCLSRTEELLGINGYFAHLVKCLDLARRSGHRLLSLIYGEAVSGGFLSFGLMADEIHALKDARVRVMNLPAMAKITKLPLEMLETLSTDSPWFAPGVDNFYLLGGIHSVWSGDLSKHLQQALIRQNGTDRRRSEGMERQGRKLALPVSRMISESTQCKPV